MQEKIAIADDENVGSVHDRLMEMGGKLVTDTVDAILKGDVEAIDQSKFFNDISELRKAPKIFKETCRIDWNKDTDSIYNLVRGMSPYPAAWSEIVTDNGEVLSVKIYETEKIKDVHNMTPGAVRTDGKSNIDIASADGFIRLKSVQLAGKKRMDIKSLLNGFKVNNDFSFKIGRAHV